MRILLTLSIASIATACATGQAGSDSPVTRAEISATRGYVRIRRAARASSSVASAHGRCTRDGCCGPERHASVPQCPGVHRHGLRG